MKIYKTLISVAILINLFLIAGCTNRFSTNLNVDKVKSNNICKTNEDCILNLDYCSCGYRCVNELPKVACARECGNVPVPNVTLVS